MLRPYLPRNNFRKKCIFIPTNHYELIPEPSEHFHPFYLLFIFSWKYVAESWGIMCTFVLRIKYTIYVSEDVSSGFKHNLMQSPCSLEAVVKNVAKHVVYHFHNQLHTCDYHNRQCRTRSQRLAKVSSYHKVVRLCGSILITFEYYLASSTNVALYCNQIFIISFNIAEMTSSWKKSYFSPKCHDSRFRHGGDVPLRILVLHEVRFHRGGYIHTSEYYVNKPD